MTDFKAGNLILATEKKKTCHICISEERHCPPPFGIDPVKLEVIRIQANTKTGSRCLQIIPLIIILTQMLTPIVSLCFLSFEIRDILENNLV